MSIQAALSLTSQDKKLIREIEIIDKYRDTAIYANMNRISYNPPWGHEFNDIGVRVWNPQYEIYLKEERAIRVASLSTHGQVFIKLPLAERDRLRIRVNLHSRYEELSPEQREIFNQEVEEPSSEDLPYLVYLIAFLLFILALLGVLYEIAPRGGFGGD